MTDLWGYLPGVLVLLTMSGFFSGSEAAFFSLTPSQRSGLAEGNAADRVAYSLLQRSERLLMGILFWNLAINVGYFSIVSKASIAVDSLNPAALTFGGVLLIIVVGEFLPKSIALTYPLTIVRLFVFPLAFLIRLVDVFLPSIRIVNEASRRLIWPGFKSESYIELSDIDRAIDLSTQDENLFEHESEVLRNVIRLSEIRVEEWMRPRTQYRSFTPPISLDQLEGSKPPSGYMLIKDAEGNDLISYVDLGSPEMTSARALESLQQPLVVVPWCATIADALSQLKVHGRRVAIVVNEFGESVGVLTWEEIFEAILQSDFSHSQRELAKAEIRGEGEGVWIATGMTKLRRLERVLGRRFSTGQSLTIGGVIQEELHRLAENGDVCEFEGLTLEVIDAGDRGEILVRITDSNTIGPNDSNRFDGVRLGDVPNETESGLPIDDNPPDDSPPVDQGESS